MFAILTVIVLFLLVLSVLILLPILIVLKAARSFFEPAINEVVTAVNGPRPCHSPVCNPRKLRPWRSGPKWKMSNKERMTAPSKMVSAQG